MQSVGCDARPPCVATGRSTMPLALPLLLYSSLVDRVIGRAGLLGLRNATLSTPGVSGPPEGIDSALPETMTTVAGGQRRQAN